MWKSLFYEIILINMDKKYKVAIIGCGSMSSNHVYGYLTTGKFNIVAISDPHVEAMLEFDSIFAHMKNYSPKHFTDPLEMFDYSDYDVISIGTWHKLHSKWTIEAARHSPRVILCEKPMADSLKTAKEMIKSCEENNVNLIIGHQRRFLPSFIEAKDLISNGEIGKVELIKSDSAMGLFNWSTHHFDMFRFLLNDVECDWVMGSIERSSNRFEREIKIEDKAIGTFGFQNGTVAILLSDLTTNFYQGCMIYGSEGIIDLRTEYLRLFNGKTLGKWELRRIDGTYESLLDSDLEIKEASVRQVKEIYELLCGKIKTHRNHYINGYKALEMASAVYESTRLHEMIKMPLKTLDYPLDLLVDSGHVVPKTNEPYDIRDFLLRDKKGVRDFKLKRFD